MKYQFTNFSLRVVHHPGWLEKLGLKCLFTLFFMQQIFMMITTMTTMMMTMIMVKTEQMWLRMFFGCLWFHVFFLPKYASVFKLGQALESTLLFLALTLLI